MCVLFKLFALFSYATPFCTSMLPHVALLLAVFSMNAVWENLPWEPSTGNTWQTYFLFHYTLPLPQHSSILFLFLNLYKKCCSDLTLPKKVPCQLYCLLLPAQWLSCLLTAWLFNSLSKPVILPHIFGKMFNSRDHRQEASFMPLSYSQHAIPR